MEYNKLTQGEKLSKEKFFNPSREFGIMPFWFWNGEMDYDEMEYQLREYYDKGIPGIYIHARFGINEHVPYLSEDWFDRVKFTVEKAREIGLQVWVYDEYNWPSGTAGKEVMKKNPDLTQRYLELVEGDVAGQYFTFMEGTDSRYNDLEESEPVYACAILAEDLKKGNPNFINLMPSLSFDKVISWEAPAGPWKLFYFIERRASWYSDVLNEETTKEFIKLTHERYKKSLGQGFKKDIKGFYTDEPAMHYFEVGRDNYIIPWSKRMFKIFKEHNGYNLREHLPLLFFDIGEKTHQVRYDFWSALSKQYEKTYYKEIADWCDENDMVFTGHLLYEESLRLHCRTGGNLFHQLRHMDMTGVDHLYPRIGTRDMPDEHVALKIASSATHQNGSQRLLCESMGGSYWDCTMERMKWIADWEYVLGVNLFNPHGFHYTIEGERKRDWPPSQFYHHTWWEHYKLFNSYMSRLGYMLSGGRHIAKIAVLYPINSIWATYTPQKRSKIGSTIEADFNYITDRLLRLHTDFDYIDEDIMTLCEIRNGRLCIRDEEYEMLLLPAATHIKSSTMDILEGFVRAGGKVVADTLLPFSCIEGDAGDLPERVKALFGKCPAGVHAAFMEGNEPAVRLHGRDFNKGGKTIFIEGKGLAATDSFDILKKAVLACIKPEISIDSQEVFCLHRNKDGQDVFFLINPVPHMENITVTLDGEFSLQLWNLENGEIEDIHVYSVDSGKTTVKLTMQPYGSALLATVPLSGDTRVESSDIIVTSVNKNSVCGHARLDGKGSVSVVSENGRRTLPVSPKKPLAPLKLEQGWEFKCNKPNAILTDKWKVKIDDGSGDAADFCKDGFAFDGWHDFCMGAWEMQLAEEYDSGYPAKLWYAASIYADYLPDDLHLLIDGFKGSCYTLYINGKEVREDSRRSYLDAQIRELPISKYMRKGKNSILVHLTVNKKSDGMVDLLKLTGTFSVVSEDGKEIIIPQARVISTGDWTKQGYPYYSGTGIYTQTVEIPGEYADCVLMLRADVGTDVLEISVNQKPAGARLWSPYELDITPYIKPGENRLDIHVTNTLVNLLEGVRQASGLFNIEIIPYNRYKIMSAE